MARDYYETTIALPDSADGFALKPLSAVRVSVVPRGATDIAGSLIDIYQADAPNLTKGPDPKSGASGTHPFVTGQSGSVRFWADGPAELDIVFEDTQAPARVSDRVAWNAVPAKSGSIPTSSLAADKGITQAMLADIVVAQQVPIGGVINWWRPANTVALPPGFEIAAGQPVSQHEFPGVAGAITLPNLMNTFILGADNAKTDGSGAAGSDDAAGAPGIRGGGGSHQHTLTAAQMPSHNHPENIAYAAAGGHSHGAATQGGGGHTHDFSGYGVPGFSANVTPVVAVMGTNLLSGSAVKLPTAQFAQTITALGSTDTTGSAHNHDIVVAGVTDHSHVRSGGISPAGSDSPHNNMPRFYGLLRLIKVRRTP